MANFEKRGGAARGGLSSLQFVLLLAAGYSGDVGKCPEVRNGVGWDELPEFDNG